MAAKRIMTRSFSKKSRLHQNSVALVVRTSGTSIPKSRVITRPTAACVGGFLAALVGVAAQAQEATGTKSAVTAPSAATNAPSSGLLNDWLRTQSPEFNAWDLGGQLRARFEYKEFFAVPNESAAEFQRLGNPGNAYVLLRERVHVGYTPSRWFTVYAEMQDAGAYNDERRPSPDNDHYMLRQARLTLGNAQEFPLTLQGGRQEMIYGDQRLIGTADWLNIGRTFDAVKLRYTTRDYWVDGFLSQPVIGDKHEFDESDDHDRFAGIYASTKTMIPVQETQLYFLSRNVSGGRSPTEQNDKLYPLASARDIYTIGARVKSLPGALNGWDYEAEMAGQFGRFKFSDTSPSLRQEAFAAHAAAGYTWTKEPLSPRLGLEYNFATGDSNPNDNVHGTFDNLFPSNHGLYGVMDFFSLQNVHDLRLAMSVKPIKNLSVKLDLHGFWLADTHDYFYQVNGAPRKSGGYGINAAANSNVGGELDLVAAYAITPYSSAQAGYGHFFVGDYIKSSISGNGGATDANYLYAQLTFNF